MPPEVELIRPERVGEAADAIARGFQDNEIWVWMLPNDRTRSRVERRQYRALIKHVFIPRGASWMTREATGGALWYPTGTTGHSFRESMAEMLPFLPEGLTRLGKAARFEREIKARWPKEPHWYLAVLSVSPESQRGGHGSALLRPGLERIDAEGVGAYLETQREANLDFYGRFGFELVEKVTIDDELPIWLMWRPPRS